MIKTVFDLSIEDFKDNYSLDYLEMINHETVYCLECAYYVLNSPDDDTHWTYCMNIYLSEEDARTVGILDELGLDNYRYSSEDDQYIYGDGYYEYY